MTGNNNIKKRNKRWIAIPICAGALNIVLVISLIIWCFCDFEIHKKRESSIREEFSTWCLGDDCINFNTSSSCLTLNSNTVFRETDFNKKAKEAFLDTVSFNVGYGYLVTDNKLYFTGEERLNDSSEIVGIYSSEHNLSSMKRLAILKKRKPSSFNPSLKSAMGFGKIGYFSISNSNYLFDFQKEELLSIDEDYIEELCDFNKYLSSVFVEIDCGKYSKKKKEYEYEYNGQHFVFNEQSIIGEENSKLLEKYGFRIACHYSFPTGETILAYYGNGNFLATCDCVTITYNRATDTFLESQLFESVSSSKEKNVLYHKIDLEQ